MTPCPNKDDDLCHPSLSMLGTGAVRVQTVAELQKKDCVREVSV